MRTVLPSLSDAITEGWRACRFLTCSVLPVRVACNLRCPFCFSKSSVSALRHERADWRRLDVAGYYAFARARGATRLVLTGGGEPLLRADTLFEVLRAARALERERQVPLTAKVSTNGLLLTEDVLARAADGGLFISLSFDGVPAAQDAGRVTADGRGSSAEAERALRLLLHSGRPFGVYSVITPANVRHLAEFRRALWDAGVRVLVSSIDYTAD